MKGLLLKDWYQVRTNMKTMYLTVAFVLVIWVLSTSSAYVFPVSYAAIFLGIQSGKGQDVDHEGFFGPKAVQQRQGNTVDQQDGMVWEVSSSLCKIAIIR